MKKTSNNAVRTALMAVAALVAMVFASTTLYSAVQMKAPGKVIVKKFQKKKQAVPFPHKVHTDAGLTCKSCHHKTEPGATPAACTTCHTMPAKDDATPSAKKAFHKTCMPCHKKAKKAGKKTGPTSCKECHSA